MVEFLDEIATLLVLVAVFGYVNHRFLKLPRTIGLLLMALRAITHLGGRKSRGLGRCRVGVEVEQVNGQSPPWSHRDLLIALQEMMP